MDKGQKLVVDELLTRQIGSLLALNKTTQEIAKELNISYNIVRRLVASKAVKDIVKEIGDSSISAAKSAIRLEMSRLVPKILEVIYKQLDEGNLEAVKVGLKILGFNDQEQVSNQPANLTVVLPGQNPTPNVIEVIDESNKEN